MSGLKGMIRVDLPTPDEMRAAQTAYGGWTAETLASWGVPWPPPAGWKKGLERFWAVRCPECGQGPGHRCIRIEDGQLVDLRFVHGPRLDPARRGFVDQMRASVRELDSAQLRLV